MAGKWNVIDDGVTMVAEANDGYVIDDGPISYINSISTGSYGWTADVLYSKYALSVGDRIVILVSSEYIKTTIDVANIISEDPFIYDTSAITNGSVPSTVYFASDLEVEILDMIVYAEFANISTSTTPDELAITREAAEEDNLFVVTEDGKRHKVEMANITPGLPIPEIRYIRDYADGSTFGRNSEWREIKAYSGEVNVALGAYVFGSSGQDFNYRYSNIVDGDKNTSGRASVSGLQYVQVDLGTTYSITSLVVYHGYGEYPPWQSTKIQVSADGNEWFTLFDSAVSGVYYEPYNGQEVAPVTGLTLEHIVNTASITKGEIPSRAYFGNMPVMLGDETMENKHPILYSMKDDGETLSAILKKRCVSLSGNSMELRIDFLSRGDRLLEITYSMARVTHDRYYPSSVTLPKKDSDISVSQTVIFAMH